MFEGPLFYYPVAFALGILHSFEPAHGKAVLVTYLVGKRRRMVDAFVFGLVITIAHTFSIMLLGLGAWAVAEYYGVTLSGSMISLVGGLLVLGVGFWMLVRWRAGACPHPGHGHHDHHHTEVDVKTDKTATNTSSFGQLVLVGIGGGLVPCPSGVAMLMTAVAAGDLTHGLGLAVAFSMGAGVVVVALSLLIFRASEMVSRWTADTNPVIEYLPLAGSLLIISIGMWLSASSFLDMMQPS